MKTQMDETVEVEVEVEVIAGVEGPCLAINGLRVSGPKPWGGGTVTHRFYVKRGDIERAFGVDFNAENVS